METSFPRLDIRKLPYNGSGLNLIDKFLIIGYDTVSFTRMLSTLFEANKKKLENIQESQAVELNSTERPIVLNEIVDNYEKELLDNELIIEILFPKNPPFFVGNQGTQNKLLIEPAHVFFSLGPQDDKNSKKSFNGFGKIFYESTKYSGYKVYYPRVIFFLSEYPYFTNFYKLSNIVLKMFYNVSLPVPMEVFLHNLIKYAPSPINYSVLISNKDFRSSLHIVNGDSNHNSKSYAPLNRHSNLDASKVGRSSAAPPPDIRKVSPVEKKLPSNEKSQKIPKKDDVKFAEDDLFFSHLSGYPLINYNISILFNILKPEMVIEIFFFTFLEADILFYSQSLEILNMIMYSFTILNYPCNDSIYFWHILSVSIDTFMKGNSAFVGKTCSTLIGINDAYDDKVKTNQRVRDHFVLDIDNKEFFFKPNDSSSTESKNIMNLHSYIKKVLKTKDTSTRLGEAIFELCNSCTEIYRKVVRDEEDSYNIEEPKIFVDDTQTIINSQKIQKMFYLFILKVFAAFYDSFLELGEKNEDEKDDEKTCINGNSPSQQKFFMRLNVPQSNTYSGDDSMFFEKFKESSKYGSFLVNFCLYFDAIDLFKIPLLFADEFVHKLRNQWKDKINKRKSMDTIECIQSVKTQFSNISFLEMIDEFYENSNIGTIFSLKEPSNKKKTLWYRFDDFFLPKEKKKERDEDFLITDFLFREKYEFPLTFEKKSRFSTFWYKKVEISQKYLIHYMFMLSNYDEGKLSQLYPHVADERKKITIPKFGQSIVGDFIENYLIRKKMINQKEILICSILSLYGLTRGICKKKTLTDCLNIANSKAMSLRNCLLKIIKVYTLLIKNASEALSSSPLLEEYCMLVKWVKERGILPNEELMELLNTFTKEIETSTNETSFPIQYEITIGFDLDEKRKEENKFDLFIWKINQDLREDIYDKRAWMLFETKNVSITEKITGEMKMICKIKSDKNESTESLHLYPIYKLHSDSKKLFYDYLGNLDYSMLDKNKIIELIWNAIFYSKFIKYPINLLNDYIAEKEEKKKTSNSPEMNLYLSQTRVEKYNQHISQALGSIYLEVKEYFKNNL